MSALLISAISVSSAITSTAYSLCDNNKISSKSILTSTIANTLLGVGVAAVCSQPITAGSLALLGASSFIGSTGGLCVSASLAAVYDLIRFQTALWSIALRGDSQPLRFNSNFSNV